MIWQAVAGGVVGIGKMVTGIFAQKSEAAAKAIERADSLQAAQVVAKIERIKAGNASAAELDAISIKTRGWKDEYLLLITTAPVILAFVPDMGGFIENGFNTLTQSVPEYYWYALAMIYIDTFGFRRMLRVAVESYLSSKEWKK